MEKSPHMIINVLEDQGPEVRGKIRDFLGTRQKTEFFENLDDFANCVKTLHGNAKYVATKITRQLRSYGGD